MSSPFHILTQKKSDSVSDDDTAAIIQTVLDERLASESSTSLFGNMFQQLPISRKDKSKSLLNTMSSYFTPLTRKVAAPSSPSAEAIESQVAKIDTAHVLALSTPKEVLMHKQILIGTDKELVQFFLRIFASYKSTIPYGTVSLYQLIDTKIRKFLCRKINHTLESAFSLSDADLFDLLFAWSAPPIFHYNQVFTADFTFPVVTKDGSKSLSDRGSEFSLLCSKLIEEHSEITDSMDPIVLIKTCAAPLKNVPDYPVLHDRCTFPKVYTIEDLLLRVETTCDFLARSDAYTMKTISTSLLDPKTAVITKPKPYWKQQREGLQAQAASIQYPPTSPFACQLGHCFQCMSPDRV